MTPTLRQDRALQLRETAEPAVVSRARTVVTDLLDREAPGLAAEAREGIRLAVMEACATAVRHAYAPGHPGELELTVTLSDGELRVGVRDFGRGMRGGSAQPGLGLGLVIMNAASDSLELRAPDDGGTEVRMRFRLAGAR